MIFPSITLSPQWLRWITPPKGCGATRHFNGSICRHQGQTLYAWRQELPDGHSVINLGRIDLATGKVTKAVRLGLHDCCDAEDPRLWSTGDKLWLGWCRIRDTRHGGEQYHARQWIARIEPSGTILNNRPWEITGIHPGQIEKNWVALPDGGMLYDISRGISYTPQGRKVSNEPLRLHWGTLSGRTPFIEWPERSTWLAMVGGWQRHTTAGKRYYFLAAEMDPRSYRIIRMSRTPLVWASEADPIIECPREASYAPLVVFPAGLLRDGDRWIVSGGVHDSRDALWTFTQGDLQLVPAAEAVAVNRLIVGADCRPPAGGAVVKVARQPVAEPGGPFFAGDHFLTTIDRANGLGRLVEVVREACHA